MGILYFDYEKDEFSAVTGMLSIFKNTLEEWLISGQKLSTM